MSSTTLPQTYKSVHLASRPKDHITSSTFTTKTHTTPTPSSLKPGQILFQSNYLSLDPAMRGWLNDTRSYVPPVGIGEVMRGACVGVVVASRSDKFREGEVVVGMSGWSEVAVLEERDVEKIEIPSAEKGGKMTDALGVLGLTGLTAYFGILEVGQVKAGDFVVVSGAAGATGSVVGQIAKLKGARVLGLAGSDDKVAWLKNELGFDDALNYKDPDFVKKFRAATKSLIDVFFDNVGGDILDLALSRAKPFSRFVICGAISQYNAKEAKGPKNILMVISMRIRMQGFIVFDYIKKYASARAELNQWLAEGKIKRQETIIPGGLDKAIGGLEDLFKGINTGKLLVEIKMPDGESEGGVKAKL